MKDNLTALEIILLGAFSEDAVLWSSARQAPCDPEVDPVSRLNMEPVKVSLEALICSKSIIFRPELCFRLPVISIRGSNNL